MNIKRIFLLAAVFAATTNLYGQEFGIGARIGPGISKVLSESEGLQDQTKFIGGFQVDMYAYKMFNEFVGIEGGLMFTQAGSRTDAEPREYDTKLSYLAIPISARFKFGYFTVNPGIRPSFLIKAKAGGDDINDGISSTDIGFFVSPGLQFPNGITLSTTLYGGVTNVFDSPNSNMINRNFSLQFSVGYTFFRKGD
jgi:hypothetical protein